MSDQDQLRVYAARLLSDLNNQNGHGEGNSNLSLKVGTYDLTKHHTRTLAAFLPFDPDSPIMDPLFAEAFKRFKRPWSTIGPLHVRVILGLRGIEPIKMPDDSLPDLKVGKALSSQVELLDTLTRWMVRSRQNGVWALPIWEAACRDLYAVASAADRVFAHAGRPATKRLEATKKLKECLEDCLSDSTPDPTKSIKMAVYFVVNLIMKINTQLGRSTSDDKIGSEQLIARILQANTTGNLPALGIYPRSDRTECLYRMGRVHFDKGEWAAAERHIRQSLELCYYTTNKDTLLAFLVPLMLIRGVIPSRDEMDAKKYSAVRSVYDDEFLSAFAKGDIGAFDQWIESTQDQHASFGTATIVRSLQRTMYRNALKRAWLLEGKPTGLALATIATYFTAASSEGDVWSIVDVYELCLEVASAGHVKARMFPDRLILDGTQPFPWFGPLRPAEEGSAAARARAEAEVAEHRKVAPERLLARIGG